MVEKSKCLIQYMSTPTTHTYRQKHTFSMVVEWLWLWNRINWWCSTLQSLNCFDCFRISCPFFLFNRMHCNDGQPKDSASILYMVGTLSNKQKIHDGVCHWLLSFLCVIFSFVLFKQQIMWYTHKYEKYV